MVPAYEKLYLYNHDKSFSSLYVPIAFFVTTAKHYTYTHSHVYSTHARSHYAVAAFTFA